MSLFLRSDVVLRSSIQGIELSRLGSEVSHPLGAAEVIALSLLAHYGDDEIAAEYLNACFGNPRGVTMLDRVKSRWAAYLGGDQARTLEVDKLRALIHQSRPRRDHREIAPAAITWLVTLACNRRCAYCYYNTLPWDGNSSSNPPDTAISRVRALEIIDEMAQIGVADLFLTGGEPLLRRDLPLLIARATTGGIRTHINTKYAIDKQLAVSLAHAGVTDVTYSLDAGEPRLANGLTGDHDFYCQALAALRNLISAGVNTRVNAVVSSVNAGKLHRLLGICADQGVFDITLSPLSKSLYGRKLAANLQYADDMISHEIQHLRRDFPKIRIHTGSGARLIDTNQLASKEQLLCEVGIRTLDILPDGRVTRCRYAPADSRLVVGDLKTQSLMDIWNGKKLSQLTFPDRRSLTDTQCAGCQGLEACNDRGRCLLSSLSKRSQLFGPDIGCHQGHHA